MPAAQNEIPFVQAGAELALDPDALLLCFEQFKLIKLAFKPPVRDDDQSAIALGFGAPVRGPTLAKSTRGRLGSGTYHATVLHEDLPVGVVCGGATLQECQRLSSVLHAFGGSAVWSDSPPALPRAVQFKTVIRA